MKRDDFIKYCDFIFNVLNEFRIRRCFYNTNDCIKYVQEHSDLYIKKEAFQILFDTNKITPAVFQTVAQEYAWAAGRLQSEFNIPNESEMESIARSWTTLVQRVTDFDDGFKSLGNREYLKRH